MPENIVITAELKDLVSGHLKDITSQVNRLDDQLKNVGSNKGGSAGGGGLMGSFLGANLLTQGIGMATGALKDFAMTSVQSYMKTEMYEARLTTLLHSREAATSALANITTDAINSSFDRESLVQGNSMLIGAGESARGARKSIMDLGNAIAATGGGSDELSRMAVNLAQIKSIGKASALDVKQFMYANIPIYDMLAKSMHKTTKEVKDMDISYEDLTKSLAEARKEGGMFYQGLENANKTLSGQVSSLADSWDILKSSIAESQSGILKGTVTWANDMLQLINKQVAGGNFMEKATGGKSRGNSFWGNFLEGATFGKFNSGDGKANEQNYAYGQMLNDKIQNKTGNNKDISETARFISGELEYLQRDKDKFDQAKGKDSEGGIKYLNDLQDKRDMLIYANKLLQNAVGQTNIDKEKATKESQSKASKSSDLEKVARGNRPTQVNINIENLVREYKNTFNNVAGALEMTTEQLAKSLISAVNDVSVFQFGS